MAVVVGIGCLLRIAVGLLAFANACNEFVLLLGEGGEEVVRQVVDFHKTCRSECRLGAVVRS